MGFVIDRELLHGDRDMAEANRHEFSGGSNS